MSFRIFKTAKHPKFDVPGGDIAMNTYCQTNRLPSIQLMVNNDDPVREYEYSEKGNESLDAAATNGWNVVSMKNDRKKIFEFE